MTVNDIPLSKKKPKGEEEEHINILTSKLKSRTCNNNCSTVSNSDTDKSTTVEISKRATNVNVSDDQQQTICSNSGHGNNTSTCNVQRKHFSLGEHNTCDDDLGDKKLNNTSAIQNSNSVIINIEAAAEEEIMMMDGNRESSNEAESRRAVTPPPTDEELQGFLDYMGNGAAEEMEYENDQMRKRTAAELGEGHSGEDSEGEDEDAKRSKMAAAAVNTYFYRHHYLSIIQEEEETHSANEATPPSSRTNSRPSSIYSLNPAAIQKAFKEYKVCCWPAWSPATIDI